jgi:hypothetical protein
VHGFFHNRMNRSHAADTVGPPRVTLNRKRCPAATFLSGG